MSIPLKIVFMGTPDFAARILNKLFAWDGCEVVAAYCQPDRPAGRGKKIVQPAVKVKALEHNIPVYQPLNFKNLEDVQALEALSPDILAVAAYGLILPQRVLDIPSIAPLNVHASLLPLYRGAAPIQRAIMDNCLKTGVSIMCMEAGLDTGPVYAMSETEIANHTAASLHDELSSLGADLLISVLSELRIKKLEPIPQDNNLATYAAKLSKADSKVDWSRAAANVHAHIRGVTPWPGVNLCILRRDNTKLELKLMPGSIGAEKAYYAANLGIDVNSMHSGQIWRLAKDIIGICTADNFYILQNVRPLNKAEMSISDFARGYLSNELGLLATVERI